MNEAMDFIKAEDDVVAMGQVTVFLIGGGDL